MNSQQVNRVELVSFSDELTEFNEHCAFLCDALSALFAEQATSSIDSRTAQGVRTQCHELKQCSENLEVALNRIYQ